MPGGYGHQTSRSDVGALTPRRIGAPRLLFRKSSPGGLPLFAARGMTGSAGVYLPGNVGLNKKRRHGGHPGLHFRGMRTDGDAAAKFRIGSLARRCEVGGCGSRSYRHCRACGRVVCPAHRFGAGWWFRCPDCPWSEVLALWRARGRERATEERLELLRAMQPLRCRRCGLEMADRTTRHGWRVWRLGCNCGP